jgi:hypothetical protein
MNRNSHITISSINLCDKFITILFTKMYPNVNHQPLGGNLSINTEYEKKQGFQRFHGTKSVNFSPMQVRESNTSGKSGRHIINSFNHICGDDGLKAKSQDELRFEDLEVSHKATPVIPPATENIQGTGQAGPTTSSSPADTIKRDSKVMKCIRAIPIRESKDLDSPKVGLLACDEIVECADECEVISRAEVKYLSMRLMDGRGWVNKLSLTGAVYMIESPVDAAQNNNNTAGSTTPAPAFGARVFSVTSPNVFGVALAGTQHPAQDAFTFGAGKGGAVFGNGGFAGTGRGGLLGGVGGMAPVAPMGNGLFNAPKQEASQLPGHAYAQVQAQGNLQFGAAVPVFGAGAPPTNNAAGLFGANPAPVFGGAAPNILGGQQPAQQAFGFRQPGASGGAFGNGAGAGAFQVGVGAQAQPKANAGQQANALTVFTTQQAPQQPAQQGGTDNAGFGFQGFGFAGAGAFHLNTVAITKAFNVTARSISKMNGEEKGNSLSTPLPCPNHVDCATDTFTAVASKLPVHLEKAFLDLDMISKLEDKYVTLLKGH